MSIKYTIDDHVEFRDTADEYLDGARGRVVGFTYEFYIVLFDEIPQGYFPAIVISGSCLKLIGREKIS